jgi:hypothetical protein
VKDTKSETSTAKAPVTPNCMKMRPIMPPMNATGKNTGDHGQRRRGDGEADLVRALLRRGVVVLSPSRGWRTMFSRTTIASSINRPMASESASSVMVFSVKPNTHMMKNDEMIDTGSVRPVMTVERQEFRNR